MSDDVEMEEAEASSSEEKPVEKRVYLPGQPINPDEELVCDPSAYHMLHPAATGAPCLSFDVIPDHLGSKRETFPQTCYLVAGTQADRANGNSIILMKVSNLVKTLKEDEDEESESESESEDEDGEKKVVSKDPKMDSVLIRHQGCINRIRCTPLNGTIYTAVWSELGKVSVLNLKSQLQTVENPFAHPKKGKKGVGEPIQPVFTFTGHQSEGYAMDWSTPDPGVLATGDCKKFVHIWTPRESTWNVDQRPLIGHTDSVEDLQWSPSEKHVLASCSVDKSLRIWDTRESGAKACKLTVKNAHESDVNVISWNKQEPLLVSGGDDGFIHVWDLRNFKTGEAVATLKHHTESVTTVEWHPSESSVLASGGADDQIALWDLAVEKDDSDEISTDIKDLPGQLLFIHQGQTDIKELHWHPQIPGMIISTANSGFNFFKTISV